VKDMFGYTPYQLYGLLQAISTLWSVTSHNYHKQGYAQWLGLQCLHKAASTIAHSHCLTCTTQGERHSGTHRGRDFEKGRCR